MKGDAAGGTLTETVRGFVAVGVIPGVEAHGVES